MVKEKEASATRDFCRRRGGVVGSGLAQRRPHAGGKPVRLDHGTWPGCPASVGAVHPGSGLKLTRHYSIELHCTWSGPLRNLFQFFKLFRCLV
jgi:hypothetical protein